MSPFLRRIPVVLGALAALGCKDAKPTTGSLIVAIDGLPVGALADVSVVGPNSFQLIVPATTTIEKLAPGEYTVRVRTVTHQNSLYASTVAQEKKTIVAGATETSSVPYALASGMIDLSISGLPAPISPNVQIFGTSGAALGYSRMVLASGIVGAMPIGDYTIRADTILSAEGDRYGTSSFIQAVTVTASLTPVPASVAFALVSGSLGVTVEGIPASQTPAPVTISGPGGFLRTTATSVTYRGLNAGTYTITAAKSGSCPSLYSASQPQQTADVAVGATVSRTVSYAQVSSAPADLNLRIDAAHLIQITQDYQGGAVPMIAGRPALLRVFGVANQCNSSKPKVRLTLSNGSVQDLVLGDAETSTLMTADQGVLATSWNTLIPASAVQPGLTFFAQIDPDNAVAEANESDNRFPATGAKAVNVRTMTPTGIRMVPVNVSANSLTGNVHSGNVDQFMELSRKLHPVFSYDVDVREVYTTSKPALQANDQNGSWVGVLGEVRALRFADSSSTPTGRYYYGVVKVSYNSGVAGIGFIGGKASLGWDFLPSASSVLAHELGHNFGRFHTPCGNPGGIDQNYPNTGFYAGGYVGTYGYDQAENAIRDPQFYTDVMGYCRTQWISDYTYVGMMDWLTNDARGPTLPTVGSNAMQPSLLVWGRIVNGQPVLEPAFEINARPEAPKAGQHRLVISDESGAEVTALSFAADRVADLPGDNEIFAFTIPKSTLRGRTVGSLRLTARGKTVTSTASVELDAESRTVVSRTGPRSVRLQWDAARFPVIMVRDPAHGHVLSFARGGDITIQTQHDALELVYSNRVRSTRRAVQLK